MKVLKKDLPYQMGVPKFYGQYITKETKAVKSRFNGSTSSLSIDMNGIIHQCAQKVFNYGGKDEIEQVRRRQEDLSVNIDILNQQCYDMITNDIADHVKRFKPKTLVMAVDGPAPLGKIKQQRIRRYLNKSSDPTLRFSSAAISPGTLFMIGLDKHIHRWMLRSKGILPKTTVYSSHLVPGEGEHKIMELMREGEVYGRDGGVHVLLGEDADLMFLALLSPIKNIWVLRGRDYVDIDQLDRDIRGKGIDVEDFVIIGFLLGNDFLPHIISLNDVSTTLSNALQAYKNNGKKLVGLEGKLDREAFKDLVYTLALSESLCLKEIAQDTSANPIKALEQSKVITQYGYNADVNIDFNQFYSNWYYYALSPKVESSILPYDPDAYIGEAGDIIKDVTRCYLNTIEWVFNYYRTGHKDINLTWYYPYDFAPLLIDIAGGNFTDDQLVEYDPVHKFFHPIQQLFMILGPHQAGLIPLKLGSLMTTTTSPLIDLYPVSAYTSAEGYKTDWQLDVYLPELDPIRICQHVVPSKINGIEKLYPYVTTTFIMKN
jgi:5'-3' exonuclease